MQAYVKEQETYNNRLVKRFTNCAHLHVSRRWNNYSGNLAQVDKFHWLSWCLERKRVLTRAMFLLTCLMSSWGKKKPSNGNE